MQEQTRINKYLKKKPEIKAIQSNSQMLNERCQVIEGQCLSVIDNDRVVDENYSPERNCASNKTKVLAPDCEIAMTLKDRTVCNDEVGLNGSLVCGDNLPYDNKERMKRKADEFVSISTKNRKLVCINKDSPHHVQDHHKINEVASSINEPYKERADGKRNEEACTVEEFDNELLSNADDQDVRSNETLLLSRKKKIMNFFELPVLDLPNGLLSRHLYIPKYFLKLSKLFKVLKSIQRFNSARSLTTIYAKTHKSMEATLKQSVCIEDMERMHWVAVEMLKFRPISICHLGETVDTFTIHVTGECSDFDDKLFKLTKKRYFEWIGMKGYSHYGSRFHPEFDVEEVGYLERRDLFSMHETASQTPDAVDLQIRVHKDAQTSKDVLRATAAKERAATILERIREKERLRREAFVQQERLKDSTDGLEVRLALLFKTENKKAIELTRAVTLLNLYNGHSQIRKLVERNGVYYIKVFKGEEYVCIRDICR